MFRSVPLVLGILAALQDASPAQDQPKAPSLAGRSTVYAPNGAIATSQPLATAAGLNVVEPMMTGAGGDLFALLWSAKEKKLVGLNGSGRSGSLISRDLLIQRGHRTMPSSGPESTLTGGSR